MKNEPENTLGAADTPAAKMPLYDCHKRVRALKIISVSSMKEDSTGEVVHRLHFFDRGYAPKVVSSDFISRHKPGNGSYYVVYEDGYESVSPGKAFEEGYTLHVDPPVPVPVQEPDAALHVSRQVVDHKVNGLNERIDILVCDEPGPGNAHHEYRLVLREKPEWPSTRSLIIQFQKGPILEAGYNGFTNEVLLAVVIDRMRGFQSGPFKCRENALALTALEEALMWLQYRTRHRMLRGVEGTNKA